MESFVGKSDYDIYLENWKNIKRFGISMVNKEFVWEDRNPEWVCQKCGRVFRTTVRAMSKLPGCRECAKEDSSLGEEEICYILEEKGYLV